MGEKENERQRLSMEKARVRGDSHNGRNNNNTGDGSNDAEKRGMTTRPSKQDGRSKIKACRRNALFQMWILDPQRRHLVVLWSQSKQAHITYTIPVIPQRIQRVQSCFTPCWDCSVVTNV